MVADLQMCVSFPDVIYSICSTISLIDVLVYVVIVKRKLSSVISAKKHPVPL